MEVNPANGPRVNAAGGKAFADFMVSPEVQDVIRTFGLDRYGQALFVPVAGKREEDLWVRLRTCPSPRWGEGRARGALRQSSRC